MRLEVKTITKYYGKKQALDQVSFTLEPGVYGLLGPNGAGKSTLLEILTQNLKPSSGQILWDGTDIEKMEREYRAVLGYMPQAQTMYPAFRCDEFLIYLAALQGIHRREREKAVQRTLKAVNLQELADKKIKTLSGGMKQRLLLAQAILADPSIVILDEPTAGLDPYQRIAMRNLIASLAEDRIILIATHVVQDIEVISKEVMLLQEGRMVKKDAPHRLRQELEGKLFEVMVEWKDVDAFLLQKNVYGMREIDEKTMVLRLCLEQIPNNFQGKPVNPTLEDVYLYQLGGNVYENSDQS